MSSVFRLSVLPAGDGDCLILTWGRAGDVRHVVVDGGRAGAWVHLRPRLQEMADAGERLERLVLTHIDADHIEGLLLLARDEALPIAPAEVWYNGFDQMIRMANLGERQGDEWSAAIARLGWPLNRDFAGGVATVENAADGIEIAGLRITMLSPGRPQLAAMAARWSEWRRRGGRGAMVPMGGRPMPRVLDVERLSADTPIDREPPNGSSIAFLAEFDGRRVLLAGDAHPDVLAAALAPLAAAEGGRLRVDLVKLSHHGSRKNTTRALLRLLDCRRFVFSSDGGRHGHPDPETVARVLRHAPEGGRRLYFNYRSRWTEPWDDPDLRSRYGYDCVLPPPGGEARTLDIDVAAIVA